MSSIIKYLTVAVFFIGIASCEKIFEEDIEKQKVIIISPADSALISGQSVTFWWEEIEGATQYELQVVSPGFNNATQLLLDTLLDINKCLFNFNNSGAYECRVRALNGAYRTAYTIHSFTLDSSSNLSAQALSILSPDDNLFTKEIRITFEWLPLLAADDYRFEIASPDFNGNTILDVNLNQTSFAYTLDEGTYSWRVRAQNSSSNTSYVTRSLTIDLTPPTVPSLLSPEDNAVIPSDTAILTWSSATDIAFDSVFIYQDSLALLPVVMNRSVTRNYSFGGVQGEDYFWRVKSVDNANNTSPFSLIRKFTFQ